MDGGNEMMEGRWGSFEYVEGWKGFENGYFWAIFGTFIFLNAFGPPEPLLDFFLTFWAPYDPLPE